MMANQVLLSAFVIIYFLNAGNGYYYYWYTTDKMKTKLLFMKRELIMDAIRNIARVDHFKEYYTVSPSYDVGQMLYFIRSKFARMVRLLILTIEKDHDYYYFHEHLPNFKEVHHLSMDIYNLVEMLEEYEAGAVERSAQMDSFKKKKRKPHRNTSYPNGTEPNLPPDYEPGSREKADAQKQTGGGGGGGRGGGGGGGNLRLRNRKRMRNKKSYFDAGFDSELE